MLQKNLDLTEQVIRNMEARRTQGTALKNDITRYELQKETLKLQLAKVKDACKIMNHQLVTTLHLPAGTEIIPDSTLLDEEVKALAENDWQLLASQSNVGLQQAQLAMKMSKQKVKLERSELLPKIALVAGEHLTGLSLLKSPCWIITSIIGMWGRNQIQSFITVQEQQESTPGKTEYA